MIAGRMNRVDKDHLCPVCGKSDWCLVAGDGSAAICARIEDGSVKRCGDAGYLHILDDQHRSPQGRSWRRFAVGPVECPDRDFAALQGQYSRQITGQQLHDLGRQLGLSVHSLKRLHIGWDGSSFTFPMHNAEGNIVGIRRRFPNGSKLSVKGSRTGLFVPDDLYGRTLLLVCEGPTDTAAALDLGFDAIGRPNCNSRIEMTAEVARGPMEVVIVGDNDVVGRTGAEKLADVLVLHCPCVKIVYPPDDIKDLRQWLQAGLTHETLQQIIKEAKSIELAINFKDG